MSYNLYFYQYAEHFIKIKDNIYVIIIIIFCSIIHTYM